jgi:hypothetical protein
VTGIFSLSAPQSRIDRSGSRAAPLLTRREHRDGVGKPDVGELLDSGALGWRVDPNSDVVGCGGAEVLDDELDDAFFGLARLVKTTT